MKNLGHAGMEARSFLIVWLAGSFAVGGTFAKAMAVIG